MTKRAEPPAVVYDGHELRDDAAHVYADHSTAKRISTDTLIVNALRKQFPDLTLTVTPSYSCQLLPYAGEGHASATPVQNPSDPLTIPYTWRMWMPPVRRTGGGAGALLDTVQFARFMYRWKDQDFILYLVSGRDGTMAYPEISNNYILSADAQSASQLISECSRWSYELHSEIWLYDQGYWSKSAELWESIQKSEWKDVILDEDMKKSIIDDIEGFYASRDTYRRLKVPWKRGLIFWGPPGNGKTISIKATMHSLYKKSEPIPTLYVRSLVSYGGPEMSIKQIFNKARQEAPCFLIFEDLDSIITDEVRSYFLNEVDGLKDNDGILMVGSTNHLDRLDPGLSKRPSRFDRKYLFPDPSKEQRVAYAKYWQKKLSSNEEIKFPDELCPAVADITDGFSFAYIQEAFVASLLAIARSSGNEESKDQAVTATKIASAMESLPSSPDRELSQSEAAQEYKALIHKMREQQERLHEMMSKLERNGMLLDDDDSKKPSLDDLPLWQELQRQVAILREGMEDSDQAAGSRQIATTQPNAPAPALPQSTNRLPPPGLHVQARQFFPADAATSLPHQERITAWLANLEAANGFGGANVAGLG